MPKAEGNALVARVDATIRKILDDADQPFAEASESGTTFFTLERGISPVEHFTIVHSPGKVVANLLFGVHPDESRRAEVERLANRLNAIMDHGCAVVRAGAPCTLLFRASVDYGHVGAIEPGHVIALLALAEEYIEPFDLLLIAIARGHGADQAIDEILDGVAEVAVLPSRASKKKGGAKKKAATKKDARRWRPSP
jgi:hypothetical protein